MKLDISSLETSSHLDAPVFEPLNPTEKEAIRRVEPNKGNLTLAFIFKEGIIVASKSVDTSPLVKNIIEINPRLLYTMYGGASDCQLWHRDLWMKCRMYELENNRSISVKRAAELLSPISYTYDGVATIIAGWDEMVPCLYLLDKSVWGTLTGTRFAVGFGSAYAYALFDRGYWYDMSIAQAAKLAQRTLDGAAKMAELAERVIYQAAELTQRTVDEAARATSGVANVYYVGPNGWEKLSGNDVVTRHYHYYPVTPNTADQEVAAARGA